MFILLWEGFKMEVLGLQCWLGSFRQELAVGANGFQRPSACLEEQLSSPWWCCPSLGRDVSCGATLAHWDQLRRPQHPQQQCLGMCHPWPPRVFFRTLSLFTFLFRLIKKVENVDMFKHTSMLLVNGTEFHFWLNYSFHSPLPTNLTKRQHFKPRDAPTFSKPGITDEQTFSLFACKRLLITAISSSLSSQTPLILQIQGPFSVVKYDPINLIANRTVDEELSHSDGIIRELRSSVV